MRIPPLYDLCLRAVGPHVCSVEKTFEPNKDTKEPSSASRLLRSFHDRPARLGSEDDPVDPDKSRLVPMTRTPCIGKGSARRAHANDVDLNHPFIAVRQKSLLLMEHGNPALDFLQSYIDALVELARMDDTRLGTRFFREWKQHATANHHNKRKLYAPVGSLSLYNCTLSERTIHAMIKSDMGQALGVLDMSGVQGMTDDLLGGLLETCPNLTRLSLKNGRHLTAPSLDTMAKYTTQLTCLDIGGCYNVSPRQVLDRLLPFLSSLVELHASGLAWNDGTLQELLEERSTWRGLSVGFSHVTGAGFRSPAWPVTLESLAVPFCDHAVDNALLGYWGKSLPFLQCLDVRGNTNLSSMTGFFDGRQLYLAGGDSAMAESLFVLARYSNISKNSMEETQRIHPLLAANLEVVLDSGGVGGGVRR